MSKSRTPTDAELAKIREALSYEPDTGLIRWKVDRYGGKGGIRVRAGDIAGCCVRGYNVVELDWRSYKGHRIAWFLHYGMWPETDLDHWDLNRANNRIDNLRCATRSQNCANKSLKCTNTSGYKGVHWNKKLEQWAAQIGFNGKIFYLGMFATPEEAHAAYCEAAKKYHAGFARFE